MNTNSAPPQNGKASPLRDNLGAILFMLTLLVASGLTASIVGYKVKFADRERKGQLYNAYAELGGNRERLVNIEHSLLAIPLTPPQRTFLAAYELNERARSYGLYRWLEFSKPDTIKVVIQSLNEIGATDPVRVVEAAWAAMQDNSAAGNFEHPDQRPVNPKAARVSKKYDRYVARSVDTKLFKYYTDHKTEIVGRK